MALQELSQPHIESFNFFLGEGLKYAAEFIRPVEFLYCGSRLRVAVQSLEITRPKNSDGTRLLPAECRRRGINYSGSLMARLRIEVDGVPVTQLERNLGEIPVMLRSRVCHLNGVEPPEMVRMMEEAEELGGYFIIGGKERVVRMLILPRRNFPICCIRPSFKKRGRGYTEYAVIIRCVRPDQMAAINILHWRVTGEPVMNFSYHKEQFYAPLALILRALVSITDSEIYDEILRGSEDSLSLQQTAIVMLTRLADPKFSSREKALRYLGLHFRQRLSLPEWYSDLEAGVFLLNECILTHLPAANEKFLLLTYMVRKLHALARENCCVESNDRAMFQEMLLPGHLYLQLLVEKMEVALLQLRSVVLHKARRGITPDGTQAASLANAVAEATVRMGGSVSRALVYFLATGNLVARSGFGIMQTTGLVVPLDNINFMRSASHFRAVHRGAFFSQMRTTEVRKLLPEVYGFVCPVHTPDGPPCGLLNHLSAVCRVVNRRAQPAALKQVQEVLRSFGGLWPASAPPHEDPELSSWLPVLMDGRLLGWLDAEGATRAEAEIRALKTTSSLSTNATILSRNAFIEVCLVPRTSAASQFPGLFIFSDVARLMRPVLNLRSGQREWIGTFEQPYLAIGAAGPDPVEPAWTHREEAAENLFSFVASLTPFPDYNQSPRNMYQCQMGKQTMGHSSYTWRYRADNKAYRLLTPQRPIVRTKAYDQYNMDVYPLGFNAVVAVMSYTAYDMEDAMVINRASYERGLGHACIYKSQTIDLRKLVSRRSRLTDTSTCPLVFARGNAESSHIEDDGLPSIGSRLAPNDPLYAYVHEETGETKVIRYRGDQTAFVEAVSLGGNRHQATITLRIQRLPDIGDKFSSRHGQKGVNSILMGPEDMPWSESGISPDLIFNPHGIPSRMTIGMLMEFLGGKVGSLTGTSYDATPFQRDEENPPYFDMMKALKEHGYNFYGTETLYCGTTGEPIEADIFMGIVYYQRLRHMVADKWQVRSTGRIDRVTRQPLKGRKVGGGIRLGEMERDCLLSYGAPAILHERMFASCSDRTSQLVCKSCGSLTDVSYRAHGLSGSNRLLASSRERFRRRWRCLECGADGSKLLRVTVPHVLRYLAQELTAMNIRVRFQPAHLSDCEHP